jgi:hypothetical protein
MWVFAMTEFYLGMLAGMGLGAFILWLLFHLYSDMMGGPF